MTQELNDDKVICNFIFKFLLTVSLLVHRGRGKGHFPGHKLLIVGGFSAKKGPPNQARDV